MYSRGVYLRVECVQRLLICARVKNGIRHRGRPPAVCGAVAHNPLARAWGGSRGPALDLSQSPWVIVQHGFPVALTIGLGLTGPVSFPHTRDLLSLLKAPLISAEGLHCYLLSLTHTTGLCRKKKLRFFLCFLWPGHKSLGDISLPSFCSF